MRPRPTERAHLLRAFARRGGWLLLVCTQLAGSPAGRAQDSALQLADISIDSHDRPVLTVPSDEQHYYLLSQLGVPGGDGPASRPVALHLGAPGVTMLGDPLGRVPGSSGLYRVERYPLAQPGDLDRDGISDLEELLDQSGTLSPLNPADPVDRQHGVTRVLSREMFQALSYQGNEVLRDPHLAGLEFVKFYLIDATTSQPGIYFMDTERHRSHGLFAFAAGLADSDEGNLPGSMRGEIIYHPFLAGPGGTPGIYRFEFQPNDAFPFEMVKMAQELIAANMPYLRNNLFYYPMPNAALPRYRDEQARYDASRVRVLLDGDLFGDISFLPLNPTVGYGLLRLMDDPNERPGAREIVLYESLPNEMPRVGGVITTVPQTPLSHVNLRAIQDGIPNAFIRDAADANQVRALLGRYVRFEVHGEGYRIEEVSVEEVEAHYAELRPPDPQVPPRNLGLTDYLPLDAIAFRDSDAFGVKTANLATLRTFGFGESLIPDGFGLPFYFYDEFMKYNGLYDRARDMMAGILFQDYTAVREARLADFRREILSARIPHWMTEALSALQQSFPAGTRIRCRSSTNNEDLPGFSGAGLYDSYTHRPEEGHLATTIKQVYASLWNFRAFEERRFFRIDHLSTAMGVLLHPNFQDELANGVAVTTDPLYRTEGNYYLNVQVGEDLVTNPDATSIPEELLLSATVPGQANLVRSSNQVPDGQLILSAAQLRELQFILGTIQHRFRFLYRAPADSGFAMEIEFKVTREGALAVKQARPWANSWDE